MEYVFEDDDELLSVAVTNQNLDVATAMIGAFHSIIDVVERTDHIKINNYIDEVVTKYIDSDFVMHFRLSRGLSYDLIARFTTSQMYLSLRDAAGYRPITPEKHILCYLWFVGHETSSYRDVADRFGITLSSLHNIISRVTEFILSIAGNVIRFPTTAEKEITKQYYWQAKRFPGIIGSIDGSHVRIDKPRQDKDSYINRKQFFSIQLQGVVDHNKKFIDVCIGYPGSVHDARVFQESALCTDLQELCGDGYLLGDSAYPCLKNLIVPYKDNGRLTRAQTKFNQRLSSCRVTVENTFADLKQRFRQLFHFKLRDIVRMVQVIHACCVLHNLANANDLELFEPAINEAHPDPEIVEVDHENVNPEDNQLGRELRDELCRQLAAQE